MGDEDPDTQDRIRVVRDHLIRELVRFGDSLRTENVHVTAADLISAGEALALVGVDDRERVRAATRATLVHGAEDLPAFEERFPEFWYRLRAGLGELDTLVEAEDSVDTDPENVVPSETPEPVESPGMEADEPSGTLGVEAVASHVDKRSRSEDEPQPGATYSQQGSGDSPDTTRRTEYDLTARVDALSEALGALPGRSWGRNGDDALDVRKAVRESARTGGVVYDPPTRRRSRDRLSCCVLVDVSQSVLETVDRSFLLSTVSELHRSGRRVRTFFFDTAVREVTDAFEGERDPWDALERAEVEWGGGTRIGHALDTVRSNAPHAVDRSTVVLVLSDGLDVGDAELLESGMAWLTRRAGAVLWLNPLASSAAYEPTCRGMAAALPYVDGLFAFAGPDDLEEMTRQLLDRPDGPYGYRFDGQNRELTLD